MKPNKALLDNQTLVRHEQGGKVFLREHAIITAAYAANCGSDLEEVGNLHRKPNHSGLFVKYTFALLQP